MSDNQILREKIKGRLELPVIDVISQSFEIFGKAAGSYIGFMFFCLMLFAVVGFVAAFMMVGALLFGVIMMVILALLITPALQVGLARFTKKVVEGKQFAFSDFLSGFKYNYGQLVLQGFLVAIISGLVSFGVDPNGNLELYDILMNYTDDPEMLAEEFLAYSERNSGFSLIQFLGGVFSFYITLGLSLVPYIVSFYKVNAITAIDISFRAVNKVVFRAGAANLLLSLIGVMGAVFLLVGLFATLPIMFIGSYLVFRYVIGEKPENTDEDWAVIDHVVE